MPENNTQDVTSVNLNTDYTKFAYSIKEAGTDIENQVIEKRGEYAVQFTLADVTKQQNELSKMKREAAATKELHEKYIENYLANFPAMKELPEEQLHRIFLYYKSVLQVKKADATIKAATEELDNMQKEKEHIYATLNITPSPITSA